MHKPSSLKDYAVALFLGIVFGLLVLVYLHVQRGGGISLSVFNKSLASSGSVLLGIVFLIGPLMRYFSWGGYYVRYRKELGIVGAIFIVAHWFISQFFRGGVFGYVSYMNSLKPYVPGLIGVMLLVLLWVSSRRRVMEWIGGRRWWAFQRWGIRIVILATTLHVVFLRWESWNQWFVTGGSRAWPMPGLPPTSLLAFSVVAIIALIRLIEYCGLYPNQGVSIHASSGQEQGSLGEHAPSEPGHEHFSKRIIMQWVVLGGGLALFGWYVWLFVYGSRFSL